jgi:hypothetical protein
MLLFTDTHHIATGKQSNQSSTSTTFSYCSTTTQGNVIHIERPLIQLYTLYFTQTITTLNLNNSQIGDVEAQHLADALRNNTVILILSPSISYT